MCQLIVYVPGLVTEALNFFWKKCKFLALLFHLQEVMLKPGSQAPILLELGKAGLLTQHRKQVSLQG